MLNKHNQKLDLAGAPKPVLVSINCYCSWRSFNARGILYSLYQPNEEGAVVTSAL